MCAAVLLTATINTSALAQGGGGGGQRGGGGRGFGGPPTVSNLPLPYLAFALNLNDDQKTKIQAVQEKVRTDSRAARQPDASGQRPDRAAVQAKMKEINDQAKSDIEAILTDTQKRKVDGAIKEAGTFNTVGIRLEVVPDLKLTAEQKTKLTDIAETATKEMQPIMKDMADARQAQDQQKMQEAGQAMQAARKATQDKALAVLNDDQKATIEKYDKEHPIQRRGPGGAGAGAGTA
jgi:hypothetical protein